MRRAALLLAALSPLALSAGDAIAIPVVPPLGTSSNVELVANIPGSYAGIVFSDTHAYATGWGTGLTVLDISDPALPVPVGALPLPHFENEDVDLCGTTLLIANDRQEEDLGGILYVVDVSNPSLPVLASSLPLGLTGEGRGPGHIANFVTADCTQVWVDGGDDVEVVDLTDASSPRSLGHFRSAAATGPDPANPGAFLVTHDTERDRGGTLWQTGGGGIAGYHLTDDPLAPRLVTSSGAEGVNIDFDATNSPYNDFILHNSQRVSSHLMLVTEEDYIDTDEEQPGGCNGQGKFETWFIARHAGGMYPIDTWETELNAADSKAPIVVNCSSHWFDHRDGVAAVAWYEQGVRFLDYRNPRDIRQVGYYLPVDGESWAAYWVPGSTDLVYVADPARGLDVLRVGDVGSTAPTVRAPILDAWFGPLGSASRLAGALPSERFGFSCTIPAP